MFENADDDGIPFEQPDDSVPRLFVQPRSEHPPVIQAHSKERLGHYFVDDTRLFAVAARGGSFSFSRTQCFEDALRDFVRTAGSIDAAEQAPRLVVRQ